MAADDMVLAERLESLERKIRELAGEPRSSITRPDDLRLVKPAELEGQPAYYSDQRGEWVLGEGWR
jgi:hypothetical protein